MMNINNTLPKPNIFAVQKVNLNNLQIQIQQAQQQLKSLENQKANIQETIDAAYADRENIVQYKEQLAQDHLADAQGKIDVANSIFSDSQAKRLELLNNITAFNARKDQFNKDVEVFEDQKEQQKQIIQDTFVFKHSLDDREVNIIQKEKDVESKLNDAQNKLNNASKIQQDAIGKDIASENLKRQNEILQNDLILKTKQAEDVIAKAASYPLGPRWQEHNKGG